MATMKTSALALMIALAGAPVLAQTTEPPATEAPAEADAAGADGLSMGTELAGSKVGDGVIEKWRRFE